MPTLLTRVVCRSTRGDSADCTRETRRPLRAHSGHLSLIDRAYSRQCGHNWHERHPKYEDRPQLSRLLNVQLLTVNIVLATSSQRVALDCQHYPCHVYSTCSSWLSTLSLPRLLNVWLLTVNIILATSSQRVGLDCQHYPCHVLSTCKPRLSTLSFPCLLNV